MINRFQDNQLLLWINGHACFQSFWLRKGALIVLLFPLLVITNLCSIAVQQTTWQVTMGDGLDRLFVENFHSSEQDHLGKSYRWTRGESHIVIQHFLLTPRAFLILSTGGLPNTIPTPRLVHTRIDGHAWVDMPIPAEPRRFSLLLPSEALQDGNIEMTLQSETTKIQPDTRNLGIRIDRFQIGRLPSFLVFPPWILLLAQWFTISIVTMIGWRLQFPQWSVATTAIVLILLAGWLFGAMPLIATMWQVRIFATSVATFIFVAAIAPILPNLVGQFTQKEQRRMWMIFFCALVIRMVAILYPPFDSHDWYIHRKRIVDFVGGGLLIYDKPAEFSQKLTIVPPMPYLLYVPFLLFTRNIVVAMEWVYTFLDSITVLLTMLFVRRLGASMRAALLAALVMALFPLNFTVLWWGFGPQTIGQCCTLLLALFVTWKEIRTPLLQIVGGITFALLLLSHVGAGILGGCLFAGYIALVWWFQRKEQNHWKMWGIIFIAIGMLVTLLFYSEIMAMQIHGLSNNQRIAWDEDDLFRIPWTLSSLPYSFNPLGIVLPVVSLVILVHTLQSTHRLLVCSWIASALLFFIIDIATGLQVRYAYFLIPLVAAGLAKLLDGFIKHHRVGWIITWYLIGWIGFVGLRLWIEGTFFLVKPSLRGLTH